MAAYATVNDYEERYGMLSGDAEATRVSALLDVVSLFIDALVEARGIDASAKAEALMNLCRDYAHRVRENEKQGNLAAVTYQAGSFLETKTNRILQDDFDVFARGYYAILGIRIPHVMFAWPGDES